MSKNEPAAPADHPSPKNWWATIEQQAWACYAALIAEIPLLLYFGVGEHGVAPLLIANIGLVVGAVSFGGGSTLIDAIKAWRNPA